jgi:hypothetical protein
MAHTVILATQEAEIRRITVQSQPGQITKRAGRVAQDVGPEFKPQYSQKLKKPPQNDGGRSGFSWRIG